MNSLVEIHKLRPVEPLPHPEGIGGKLRDLGKRPELRWVKPTTLLVDDNYQRDLGKRSYSLIRGMMQNFAWRKMKPPIVVEVAGGLHCVDGQHTAIAAASLGIEEIPVFIVGGETLSERADSFVAHNRDRIVMAPLDVYRAKIAAGDPDALDCARVCRLAGVRIRQIQPAGRNLVGDTGAVGTIQRLVKRRGVSKSRELLSAFVLAGRGPITPAEIDAAEALMMVSRPTATAEQLAKIVKAIGDHGVVEARMRSMTEKKPHKFILLQSYIAVFDRQNGHARAA
jgi:hypothetical protein